MLAFENTYFLNILFIVLLAIMLIFIISLLTLNSERRKTFREKYRDYKEISVSTIIDEEERRVERHYSFSNSPVRISYISLDEFFLKFDSKNLEKLKNWMELCHKQNYNHNIELVMYDNKNNRRVYMIECDKVDSKRHRLYLTFTDVTESLALQKRLEKTNNVDNLDSFYSLVLDKIKNTDYSSYLIAFKYREYKDVVHTLKGQFIQLVDSTVYSEIRKEKFDNDYLCIYEPGVILLCAYNVSNEKRLKAHIKRILSIVSKTYTISKNQFSVTLLAGVRKINKTDENISSRVNEAIIACDDLLSHFIKANRVGFYNDALSKIEDEKEKINNLVLDTINHSDFTLNFKPFIDVNNNEATKFLVEVKLPSSVELSLEEFINVAKKIGCRKNFYDKIFSKILNSLYVNEELFFQIDYQNFNRALEAFNEKIEYNKINIRFFISFNSLVSDANSDVLVVEREIRKTINEFRTKIGLNFNSLQTIYLNDGFYELSSCILLSDDLIKHCLDNYNNNLLINLYVKLAKKYKNELYVSQINSITLYEFVYGIGANYVSGDLFDAYLKENKIEDKNFVARLEEAKSKAKYE